VAANFARTGRCHLVSGLLGNRRTHPPAALAEQQLQLPPHNSNRHHHLLVIRINTLIHERRALLSIHTPSDSQPAAPVADQTRTATVTPLHIPATHGGHQRER